MSTLPNPDGVRAYPITPPATDRRFTLGLVFDVAAALAEHGFPRIQAGADLVALQQTLYAFIYAPATDGRAQASTDRQICHGAPAGFEGDCGYPGPHGEHPIDQPPAVAE